MVIAFNDATINSYLNEATGLIKANLHLQVKTAETGTPEFADHPITVFDYPSTSPELYQNYVYVEQREYAVLRPYQPGNVSFVGSDNATTCCIIILWHKKSGCTAVAHYDGKVNFRNARKFIDELLEATNESDVKNVTLSCALVGSYVKNVWTINTLVPDSLLGEVLELLDKHEVKIQTEIACVGKGNTRFFERAIDDRLPTCYPLHYGCAINLTTLEVIPAKFVYKGPAHLLRYSQIFNADNDSLSRVYNFRRNEIEIYPFQWFRYYLDLGEYVNASDSTILNTFSTSPLVEPKDFASTFRKVIDFMIKHPHGTGSIFKGHRPICFALDAEHKWVQRDN